MLDIKGRLLVMAKEAKTKQEKEEVINFIKLLAVLVAYNNDLELPNKELIQNFITNSNQFFKKYSDAKTIKRMLELLVRNKKGKEWSELSNKLGESVKDAVNDIFQDSEIESWYLSLLQDLGLYLRNNSEPAYKRIVKGITQLRDMNISRVFVQKIDINQGSQIQRLKKVVQKLTGNVDVKIDAATCKLVKEDKPELYKKYLELRRNVLDTYKKTLANIVRSSGKPYLPVDTVLQRLNSKGIEVHSIPRNFIGFIGDDGSLYTIAGKHITGVPLGSVVMNPAYNAQKDDSYVFSSDGDGTFKTSQRYYTDDYKTKARTHKFEKVEKFSAKLEKIRDKWLRALKRWTGDEDSVAALMLEIAYQTQARVGSDSGSTAGEKTYGLSTWRIKHIRVKPNEVVITYTGKKGMKQKHTIKGTDKLSKAIIGHLKELVENKNPSDYLFTDEDGKPITNQKVNQYLKQLGSPVTIHKLRHARGNEMLMKIIESNPFSNKKSVNGKELETWLKKQVEGIAKALGHQKTGADGTTSVSVMTSINNYLNPNLIKGLYNDLGVHFPKWLEKLKEE